MQDKTSWVAGPFDYQRLDAGRIAREAFELGMAIVREIPKGHATLVDQLERALLSAFLNVAEAASKTGADRANRFRIAKGSASEAAAAIDAAVILGLAAKPQADEDTLDATPPSPPRQAPAPSRRPTVPRSWPRPRYAPLPQGHAAG